MGTLECQRLFFFVLHNDKYKYIFEEQNMKINDVVVFCGFITPNGRLLNGKRGKLLEEMEGGRWKIQVLDENRIVTEVKPQNLILDNVSDFFAKNKRNNEKKTLH